MRTGARIALVLALVAPVPAGAQNVTARAAIVPDSITVGAMAHAAVRVEVPAGVRVEFPDSLLLPPDGEGAGLPDVRSDSTATGTALTAAYPITAWRPGTLRIEPVAVRLITESGVDTLMVGFPEVTVVSVLPADTAGIEPKPVRDVLGAERVWWPLLVALLVALALAALALLYWRRRRARSGALEDFIPPGTPPREAALALLDRVRTLRLIENGEIRRAYILMAAALRHYLAALDPAWGPDLTTTELAVLLRRRQVRAEPALEVLARSDLVKFARARVAEGRAHEDLAAARAWVSEFAGAPVEGGEPPVLVMESG